MTTWRYDRGDKRAVAGAAEMIVIGRVLAQIDAVPQQLGRRSIPRTQFSVEVIRCLKGDRTGRMVVSQMGGRSPDGSLHVFDKDRLLRVGHVHLLAGRYSEPDGWYALIARAVPVLGRRSRLCRSRLCYSGVARAHREPHAPTSADERA